MQPHLDYTATRAAWASIVQNNIVARGGSFALLLVRIMCVHDVTSLLTVLLHGPWVVGGDASYLAVGVDRWLGAALPSLVDFRGSFWLLKQSDVKQASVVQDGIFSVIAR